MSTLPDERLRDANDRERDALLAAQKLKTALLVGGGLVVGFGLGAYAGGRFVLAMRMDPGKGTVL